ncbi:MAG: hypothetical protein Q4D65_02675 [Peptostreptococcaceae bacterium]|nr:hypothetical protein [Peptostreptococcaceae bacterium]
MYERVENYVYNGHVADFYNDVEDFEDNKKKLFQSIIGKPVKDFWMSWYTGAFDVKDTITEVGIEMEDGRKFVLMGRYHDCFSFDEFLIDYDFSTGKNSKGEEIRKQYPWRKALTMKPSVIEDIKPLFSTSENDECNFLGVEILTKIQRMTIKNRFEALDVKVELLSKKNDDE